MRSAARFASQAETAKRSIAVVDILLTVLPSSDIQGRQAGSKRRYKKGKGHCREDVESRRLVNGSTDLKYSSTYLIKRRAERFHIARNTLTLCLQTGQRQ